MAKRTAKKPAKKAKAGTSKKLKAPARRQRVAAVSASDAGGEELTFNHAMVYVKDVQRSLGFYRDLLGFKLIEDFRYENRAVYARLRAPGGDGTIALHM